MRKKSKDISHSLVYRFWKEFPRGLPFYHEYLRKMYEISCEKISTLGGTRDVSLIIMDIINVLPILSYNYCSRSGIDKHFSTDSEKSLNFDTLLESLQMFESDIPKNWQLLGFTVTLMASDLIALLVELNQNTSKEYQITPAVVDKLLDFCRHYCQVLSFSEDDVEEPTILDIYYKQIQVTWAKIFGFLSKFSFDKGMKFINNSLQMDFRKVKEDEI